jgi:hypothetical protein
MHAVFLTFVFVAAKTAPGTQASTAPAPARQYVRFIQKRGFPVMLAV